jgi:hypothetical protein
MGYDRYKEKFELPIPKDVTVREASKNDSSPLGDWGGAVHQSARHETKYIPRANRDAVLNIILC